MNPKQSDSAKVSAVAVDAQKTNKTKQNDVGKKKQVKRGTYTRDERLQLGPACVAVGEPTGMTGT